MKSLILLIILFAVYYLKELVFVKDLSILHFIFAFIYAVINWGTFCVFPMMLGSMIKSQKEDRYLRLFRKEDKKSLSQFLTDKGAWTALAYVSVPVPVVFFFIEWHTSKS
jgi:hypothetical protein